MNLLLFFHFSRAATCTLEKRLKQKTLSLRDAKLKIGEFTVGERIDGSLSVLNKIHVTKAYYFLMSSTKPKDLLLLR